MRAILRRGLRWGILALGAVIARNYGGNSPEPASPVASENIAPAPVQASGGLHPESVSSPTAEERTLMSVRKTPAGTDETSTSGTGKIASDKPQASAPRKPKRSRKAPKPTPEAIEVKPQEFSKHGGITEYSKDAQYVNPEIVTGTPAMGGKASPTQKSAQSGLNTNLPKNP